MVMREFGFAEAYVVNGVVWTQNVSGDVHWACLLEDVRAIIPQYNAAHEKGTEWNLCLLAENAPLVDARSVGFQLVSWGMLLAEESDPGERMQLENKSAQVSESMRNCLLWMKAQLCPDHA